VTPALHELVAGDLEMRRRSLGDFALSTDECLVSASPEHAAQLDAGLRPHADRLGFRKIGICPILFAR
jgi:hypothetical protein